MAERLQRILVFLLQLSLIVAIILLGLQQNWTGLAFSALTLILTFLPHAVEYRYKIDFPVEFEFLAVLFIYASVFLGEVGDFYYRFWWWDSALHIGSSAALGFVGFLILYALHSAGKLDARPWLVALFSFSFALALGAIWEIFEFSMDQLFGTNMQKNGLVDTMWDLIVDAGGALFASILGFFYLTKWRREHGMFAYLAEGFIRKNPRFVRKRRTKIYS